MDSGGSRWAAIVAVLAIGAVWAATADGGPTERGVVSVATTGHHSEKRKTIPIARKPRAEPRVAMTLPLRKFPDVLEGDRLRVTAELQTTNNCYRRTGFCVAQPYTYSPRIGARLVLARRGTATGGPGVKAISGWRTHVCDQRPNFREHHCVRVFRGSRLKLGEDGALPCVPRKCRINLVVAAHHGAARKGDVLILGIDRETGRILQGRSRLNAVRLRGSNIPAKVRVERRRRHAAVPIREGVKTSIYSMRLKNLRRGDQFTFDARAGFRIRRFPHRAFLGSQLILAANPRGTRTTPLTRSVGSLDGEVTEGNGYNCSPRKARCNSAKVGTLVIRRTPIRDGREVPLYVNYVLQTAAKQSKPGPGDVIAIDPDGFVEARRYPKRARG